MDNERDPLVLRPLAGSERPAVPGAAPSRPVPADLPIEVTVVLRRSVPAGGGSGGPSGASEQDARLVRDVLAVHGAQVVEEHLPSRRLTVAGPAGALSAVFGTTLTEVRTEHPEGSAVEHRQRTGGLSVPEQLHDVVVAVLGLDDRPQARPRSRVAPAGSVQTSYTPVQLGRTYAFPAGTDGSGQTLAIIELGGGFPEDDLDAYFSGLGLPRPAVRAVGVDGAANVPGGDPDGADGEVLLDIEVAGALAPGAELVVYFAPNTDRGFLDAVATATHASPTPTAMSISWGQSEDEWTAQARHAMDLAFADAAALGVTVTTAAGDDGSEDRATDGRAHVDFPAASPHVLACGGTALQADPETGRVLSETVWNNPGHGATGGGVSDTFPEPAWQGSAGVPARAGTRHRGRHRHHGDGHGDPVGGHAEASAAGGPDAGGPAPESPGTAGPNAGSPGAPSPIATPEARVRSGRGVPDVAAVADPATGYEVLVDGTRQVIGGTSAVAPLWAALVCRLAQALGAPLGLLQPLLYAGVRPDSPVPGLRDITSGSNGAYRAGPGWDACTGLGVPDGEALLARLRTAGPG